MWGVCGVGRCLCEVYVGVCMLYVVYVGVCVCVCGVFGVYRCVWVYVVYVGIV